MSPLYIHVCYFSPGDLRKWKNCSSAFFFFLVWGKTKTIYFPWSLTLEASFSSYRLTLLAASTSFFCDCSCIWGWTNRKTRKHPKYLHQCKGEEVTCKYLRKRHSMEVVPTSCPHTARYFLLQLIAPSTRRGISLPALCHHVAFLSLSSLSWLHLKHPPGSVKSLASLPTQHNS